MTKIKIASWNINSVRLRIEQVLKFIKDESPDVLCLQEIKCQNHEFPHEAFDNIGFFHKIVRGQKGFHGVAIVSRLPLIEAPEPEFCMHGHSRIAAARIDGGPIIHNLYIPAGGDIPDASENDKFAHKLDFLAKMEAHYADGPKNTVLVGDLNIAPQEHDVWSHKALLNVVSHTPIETETLERLREAAGFIDIAREKHRPDEKLYSWWSYRSPDWTANDRGRRLDHIWASQDLLPKANIDSFKIHRDTRAWQKPSDHVPICIELEM